MAYGPVELIVVEVRGGRFSTDILPALRDLVARDTVRIIDLAFVHRDPQGAVTTSEMADLDVSGFEALAPMVSERSGLLAEEDLADLGELLKPGATAGVMLLEHHWARRLDEDLRRMRGKVLLHLRVPRDTIVAVQEARAAGRR